MPSKPNYNYQRAERDRAKKALKDSKLQERKERKAAEAAGVTTTEEPGATVQAPEDAGPDQGEKA